MSEPEKTRKKRESIAFEPSKALIEIDAASVAEVHSAVEEYYKEFQRGLPTPVLAEKLCGHAKYAPVILYLVAKYLDDKVEAALGPGGGLLPKGSKPVAGATSKPMVDIDPEQVEIISEKIHSILAKRPSGVPMISVSVETGIPVVQIMAAIPMLTEFECVNNKMFRYAK